jgi:molybdate transport system substrate-binding protein
LSKKIGKISILLMAFLILTVALAGCGEGNPPAGQEAPGEQGNGNGNSQPPAPPVEITVSAAASLTDVMEEIKGLYEGKSNHTLAMNYGSSGALQQQIEEGAPADIFISAAQKQMGTLQEKGLIDEGSRIDLLENAVVLIVPADGADNEDIADFQSLAADSVVNLAIGEPESVPAGRYAKEILTSLELWEALEAEEKLVLAKDVRQVLTYVERGDVDAGIVYMTDALSSEQVKVVAPAPAGSHTPVTYPAAIVKESAGQDAAEDFMAFLQSEEIATVFEKHGFTFIAGK